MEGENLPVKKTNPLVVVLIIIIIVLVLAGVVVAGIYFYNKKYKSQKSDQSSATTQKSEPNLADVSTWTTYTKAGDYSIKMPPNLIRPGNDTALEEMTSFSDSGDYGVDSRGNEPPQEDISLSSTIWSESNSQNFTAKQAVEYEKSNIQLFPSSNFSVIEESALDISGTPAYKGVWSYSDKNTGLTHYYAIVCAVKNGKVYKITFTVSGNTAENAASGWSQYSYLFDKMISAFIFL